ncbi:MAG: THUMP-like domain-containing protein [Dehalococcoidia bacterium]
MELRRARFLASPAGQAALMSLPNELAGLDAVRLQTRLRKSFGAEEASALAEQLEHRAKAVERFGGSPLSLYSAGGLQMMTHPLVAKRRAARLAAVGLPIVDLTCGIGGDLSQLAAGGMRTLGIDSDPVALTLAAANAPLAGVVRGDAVRPPVALAGCAVVVDPARREGVQRTFDPGAYSPPFDLALALAGDAALGVVKTAPGLDHELVPQDAELEFVEVGRGLREAAIWRGVGCVRGLRRAVLLPVGVELDSTAPESGGEPVPLAEWLFDPRSCVTRAGLVRQLGCRSGGALVDRHLAYLTAREPHFDPLMDTFEVLAVVPFSVARLRAALRAGGWRPDEVRRRAFPIEPDELRRLVAVRTGTPVTVLCTTIAGERTAIIARRVDGTAKGGRQ